MTTRSRLDGTRLVLAGGIAVSALLWGAAVAACVLLVVGVLDVRWFLAAAVRGWASAAAMLAGAAAFLAASWRGRGVASRASVALWIENRVPVLRYALVTAVELDRGAAPPLERIIAGVSWADEVARALTRGLARPFTLLAGAMIGLSLLPPSAVRRVASPRVGDIIAGSPRAPTADALQRIVVRMVPPPYAHQTEQTLEDPGGVSGLAGSRIQIAGRVAGAPVTAEVAGVAAPVRQDAERWYVELSMPTVPRLVRLAQARGSRLLALEPIADSVPVVTLVAPARDTVLREPTGRLPLRARVRDDIGLSAAWFEVIVSSGEGESFQFRSQVMGRVSRTGLEGALETTLDLAALGVVPGDVVHLRAVGRDNNNVTGPGEGASETRTLRVARPGEYDSVAVDPAAPMLGDTSALSQRMLIILAQALERRRPRLERPVMVAESQAIGRDQARLRRRVADVVFMRLGATPSGEEERGTPDDTSAATTPERLFQAAQQAAAAAGSSIDFAETETPIVAINRPLLEAYNAMWDAGKELDVGEPGKALPHMRLALAAMQRARDAERIYLRGRPAAVVLDLARVRLSGDRSAAEPSSRRPGVPTPRTTLRWRFNRVLAAVMRGEPEAVDSLLVLRLDALGAEPAFAGALAQAIGAGRAGRDMVRPLLLARSALAAGRATSGLAAWDVPP